MPDDVVFKIESFFSTYPSHSYAKGQVLILNGDTADFVYYLTDGKVKQYDVTYRGDEIILNIFKPPAFFPMSLAMTGLQNRYIYEAETDVTVRQVPAELAVQFLRDNPDVLFDLLRRVYIGVEGLLGRMSYLMASSAKSRLIYELIIEARRFGEQLDTGGKLIVTTEKELGSRAGLSRETVSREVKKLKRDNLIEIKSKGILLLDVRALEKMLGEEI